jgi:hypothetical protein
MNNNKRSSIFFIFFATLFLIYGRNYPLGNLSLIEFGFFPLIVSTLCLVLAIILFFTKDNDR